MRCQGVKDDHRGPEAFESHPQYTGRGLWNVEEGGRLGCKCPQTPSLLVRNGLSDEARHRTRAHVTDWHHTGSRRWAVMLRNSKTASGLLILLTRGLRPEDALTWSQHSLSIENDYYVLHDEQVCFLNS